MVLLLENMTVIPKIMKAGRREFYHVAQMSMFRRRCGWVEETLGSEHGGSISLMLDDHSSAPPIARYSTNSVPDNSAAETSDGGIEF